MTLQKRRDLVVINNDEAKQTCASITSDGDAGSGGNGGIGDGCSCICCSGNGGGSGGIAGNVVGSNGDDETFGWAILTEDKTTIPQPDDYRNNSLRGSTQSNAQSNLRAFQSNTYPVGTKKHIWLPPRSLLLLSGESRYLW